jgi:hypothetical protein
VKIRYTLKELGTLAVEQTGFCNGIYWRTLDGQRVRKGQFTARYRLAYVVFSGVDPAYRFARLLDQRDVERLPNRHIRSITVEYEGVRVVGTAVVAVMSPNSDHAVGIKRAPAMDDQPGYQRFFRQLAADCSPQRPWWDQETGFVPNDEDRFDDPKAFETSAMHRAYTERQADEALERELDGLEAEFDEKLWWYGDTRRRSRYAPKLGSVNELFAYARRGELAVEEVARRNKERQDDTQRWLDERRERNRQLDADQAEITTALRRGA